MEYGRQTADAVDRALQSPMIPVTGSLKSAYREIDLAFAHIPSADEIQKDLKASDVYISRRAITLEKVSNPRSDRHAMLLPIVHASDCTGCGKCEKSCVLEEAAIKVLPLELARGQAGAHYRKGWEPANQPGRPRFDQPVQNLPTQPVPGDLVPLRSGREPYAAGPAATPAASGAAK